MKRSQKEAAKLFTKAIRKCFVNCSCYENHSFLSDRIFLKHLVRIHREVLLCPTITYNTALLYDHNHPLNICIELYTSFVALTVSFPKQAFSTPFFNIEK